MNERSYERNKNTMDIKTTSPIDKGSILSISKLFKVISDPTRLSVLFLLQKKECSVGNIAISLDMEQSAISHQLKTLKDARLVKSRREGKKSMLYSLDDLHVFSILEQVLTHVNELEK
jgi:DNA-binding transcriptional ArsR family regulator